MEQCSLLRNGLNDINREQALSTRSIRRGAMADATETILTTCPRDCYDSCGIAFVKRNGGIAQGPGDRRHTISRGKLCAKCSTGYNREWCDPQARLTQPLRRIGPKGAGQ